MAHSRHLVVLDLDAMERPGSGAASFASWLKHALFPHSSEVYISDEVAEEMAKDVSRYVEKVVHRAIMSRRIYRDSSYQKDERDIVEFRA